VEKQETARLFSNERRKHTRRFDRVVEKAMAAIALLESTDGTNQEITDYFKSHVERLFLPNVRNNVVSIDKTHANTDGIPLIVARYPEVYSINESFWQLPPSRLEKFHEIYRDDAFAIRTLEAMLSAEPNTMTTKANDGLRGSAAYTYWKNETKERFMSILSRPLIQINNAHKETTKASTAAILFHELVHTDQYQRDPAITASTFHTQEQALSRELEAYDMQYGFIRELLKTGDPLYGHLSLRAPAIEYISQACDCNPPESRYILTDESVAHLKKENIEPFRPLWEPDAPNIQEKVIPL